MPQLRPLRVFLCYASQDRPKARDLYERLKFENWIDPWLDEERLLPGQDLDFEIYKATRDADVIIICVSNTSSTQEGYVQKEIKRALNIAEEKPDGTIFVIPLRLEECEIPVRLNKLQWVNYFGNEAERHKQFLRLLEALKSRSNSLPSATILPPARENHDERIDQAEVLLRNHVFEEAYKILQQISGTGSQAGYINLLKALAVLGARSFNELHPNERKRLESYLSLARNNPDNNNTLAIILLAALEIDYYNYHGQVSENNISIEMVNEGLRTKQLSEEDWAMLKLTKISEETKHLLGIS